MAVLIGILGGTGQLGSGLALRFTQAGYKVIIGSRSKENAAQAVEKLKAEHPGLTFDLSGTDNQSAAAEEAKVTAAFNTVSAALLSNLEKPLDEDILIAGDDKAARSEVVELVNAIPGLKGVEAGPLRIAKYLEEMIVLIISLNRVNKAQTGFRVTGLNEA